MSVAYYIVLDLRPMDDYAPDEDTDVAPVPERVNDLARMRVLHAGTLEIRPRPLGDAGD